MKKQLLTLGVALTASFAAFAQSASDRLDIYDKDGKFISVMKSEVQEITVGKADSGDGYSSVSVLTPDGIKTRDIDNISEIRYSPVIPNLAHQIDTVNAPNSKVVLLDWRNNTDVYGEAQIDPTKPFDWRGAWADGIPHFILDTDKGLAAEFTLAGQYTGKVYSDNPNFVFWSLKQLSGLWCDSYAFYMPFEPVVITANSWELDTYKDAPFLGTYNAYGIIPGENRITVNAQKDATITFDPNTTYVLKSSDAHEFDVLDLYTWNEEKNTVAYVPYEGELRNHDTVDVKYGLTGKFDGDNCYATIHDILNDKYENNVRYFATRKDVKVTVATADQYNNHTLVEAIPTDGSDAEYYYYDALYTTPLRLTADFSTGSSIGESCYGFLLEDGEKYIRYRYDGAGSQPEFKFRGLEYGTYTGESGDFKLDGFGTCTLDGKEGTYTIDGGAVTATIDGDERIFAIDSSAKTYTETISDPWDGQEEYTLTGARGAFRGGELNDNNSMSVKFTKNAKGKYVAQIRFTIKRTDGFSGQDGIADDCSILYDAKNATVTVTNVYMGTSATSTGKGTIKLKVSADKYSLWVDDTDSDRIFATGNVNSYLLTGTINTMTAPKPIANGTGTEADPYQLTTAEEVAAMKDVVALDQTTYFKLMNDIDMTGIDYIPAVGWNNGDYNKNVEFDGNHHVISNLTSKTDGTDFYYASLIGVLRGTVKDLGLVNVDLKSGLGASGIAVYVGHGNVDGKIINCYVTGKIENKGGYAGGLVGTTGSTATVTDSYAQVDVKGDTYVGGLVGRGRGTVTLNNCYVSGTVAGTADAAKVNLLATTDKTSGVSLAVNNVVVLNTGAETMSNYDTMLTGEISTDVKEVKTWDAFNEKKTFNDLPALNWQENAEAPKPIENGTGTEADPYQLTTAEEVAAMKDVVSKENATYFKLMNDIDMTGINHIPAVGSDGATYGFTVHFDGNHHVISNLTSKAENDEFYYASLLGVLQGSVKDLGLVNVDLKSGLGVGGIGGYAGYGDVATTIDNCYVTGKMENPTAYAGGLAGTNAADLTITNSYAQVEVKGGSYAAGLVGRGRNNITIKNSYASGTVGSAEGKTATLTLIAGTDKASGVTLTVENVVALNSGSDDATNYDTMLTGEISTDVKEVKTWDAFNEGLVFNDLPALNWQENAEPGAEEPGDETAKTFSTMFKDFFGPDNITDLEAISPIHLNDDLDLVFAKNSAYSAPSYTGSNGQVKLAAYHSVAVVGRNANVAIKGVTYTSANKSGTLSDIYAECAPAGTLTIDRNETFTAAWTDSDDENPNKMTLSVKQYGSTAIVKIDVKYEIVEKTEPTPAVELAAKYTGAPTTSYMGSSLPTETTLTFDTENTKATLLSTATLGSSTFKLLDSTVAYELEGNTVTLKDVDAYEMYLGLILQAKKTDITFTLTEDGTLTSDQVVGGNGGNAVMDIDFSTDVLTPEAPEAPAVVEKSDSKAVTDLFASSVTDLTAASPIHYNDDIDLYFEKGTAFSAPKAQIGAYSSYINMSGGNVIKVVGRNASVNVTNVTLTFSSTSSAFTSVTADPAGNVTIEGTTATWTDADGANSVSLTNAGYLGGSVTKIDVTYTVSGSTEPEQPEDPETPEEPGDVQEKTDAKAVTDLFTESVTDLAAASPVHFNDDIDLSFGMGAGYAVPSVSFSSFNVIKIGSKNVITFEGRNANTKITGIKITFRSTYSAFTSAASDPEGTLTIQDVLLTWSYEKGANKVTITNTSYSSDIVNIEVTYTVPAEGGDEPEPTPAVELAAKYTGKHPAAAMFASLDADTELTFDTASNTATLKVNAIGTDIINSTVAYELDGNTVTLKQVETYTQSNYFTPTEKVDVVFTVDESNNLTSTQKIGGGSSKAGMYFEIDLSAAPLVPEAAE